MNYNAPSVKGGRLLLLCLMGILWLGGCSWYPPPPSALDTDYGGAVHNNLAQTVVNPRAGNSVTPAVGLDPASGVNVKERYDKSFKGEEKKGTEMKISY